VPKHTERREQLGRGTGGNHAADMRAKPAGGGGDWPHEGEARTHAWSAARWVTWDALGLGHEAGLLGHAVVALGARRGGARHA
jgi:hypothetical protein